MILKNNNKNIGFKIAAVSIIVTIGGISSFAGLSYYDTMQTKAKSEEIAKISTAAVKRAAERAATIEAKRKEPVYIKSEPLSTTIPCQAVFGRSLANLTPFRPNIHQPT
jgi:hypothetical protein